MAVLWLCQIGTTNGAPSKSSGEHRDDRPAQTANYDDNASGPSVSGQCTVPLVSVSVGLLVTQPRDICAECGEVDW